MTWTPRQLAEFRGGLAAGEPVSYWGWPTGDVAGERSTAHYDLDPPAPAAHAQTMTDLLDPATTSTNGSEAHHSKREIASGVGDFTDAGVRICALDGCRKTVKNPRSNQIYCSIPHQKRAAELRKQAKIALAMSAAPATTYTQSEVYAGAPGVFDLIAEAARALPAGWRLTVADQVVSLSWSVT
jgi:hypothetical protein